MTHLTRVTPALSIAAGLTSNRACGTWREHAVCLVMSQMNYNRAVQVYSVDKLMTEARRLAVEYRRATGRALAIGGELAKHDAIRLLQLTPAPPDTVGYDAIGPSIRPDEDEARLDPGREPADSSCRYQIKGRAMSATGKGGERIGQIRTDQPWDRLLLVLMDDEMEPFEIHEATREAVLAAFESAAGSKRGKRGPMSVARFKYIGELVWSAELGRADGEIWENSP